MLMMARARQNHAAGGIAIATNLAAPVVGQPYTGSVTVTLSGGAVGPVTITVDELPDGLSLGAVTQVDAQTYRADVDGTPTTAQTVASTFTGSIPNLTPVTAQYSFVVGAVSAGLAVVQQVATSLSGDNATIPLTLNAPATAGNLLLAQVSTASGREPPAPTGWTLLTDLTSVAGSSSDSPHALYTHVAAGGETGVTFTPPTTYGRVCTGTLTEIAGAGASPGYVIAAAVNIRDVANMPTPTATPAVAGSLALGFAATGSNGPAGASTWGVGAGWTLGVVDQTQASNMTAVAWQLQGASLAAVSCPLTYATGSGANNSGFTVLIAPGA